MKHFKFVMLCIILAGLSWAGILSCSGGQQGGGGGGGGVTCTDGIKNGNETDVDCGGSCPNKCAVGKACAANGDCQTNACCPNVCVGNFANLSFGTPSFLNTGGNVGTDSQMIALGDFNKDNKLDFAVADGGGNVRPFFGNGDGTFTAQTAVATTNGTASVAAGDLNGDGALDLVSAGIDGANSAVDILMNNGTGTFTKTSVAIAGAATHDITLGDFDAKNGLDIAVSNATGNNVLVLLNSGTGTFPNPPTPFNGGGKVNSPRGIASANFQNTGDDLVTANFGNGDVVALFSDGLGAFGTSVFFTVTGSTSNHGATVGDYNKDGMTDFAVSNITPATVSANVYLNNGAGGFTAQTPNTVGKEPQSIATADFNVDGNSDLATANTQGRNFLDSDFSVLLNKGDGTGTFQAEKFFLNGGVGTTNRPRSIAAGDFNADCKPDVLLANDGSSNPNTNTVSVFLNTSN